MFFGIFLHFLSIFLMKIQTCTEEKYGNVL